MKLMMIKCTPGYPVSGGAAAYAAGRKRAHAAVIQLEAQWQRFGRNVGVTRVQTVITDVPGYRSALPFVRRP